VIIAFTPTAWDDYVHWQTADRKLLKKLNTLIAAAARDPDTGIGKPERLHGELSGAWSRRIDQEHRLVYTVEDDRLCIVACRFHYE
jgi:toxin YoeB